MKRTLVRFAIVLTLVFCAGLLLLLMAGLIPITTDEFLEGMVFEVAGAFMTAGAVYFITEGISQADAVPTVGDLTGDLTAAIEESTANLTRQIADLKAADDLAMTDLKHEIADLKATVADLQTELASLKKHLPDDEDNDD